MLKKMILALLLAANGTVAFAAQQEVVKQNETEQVEQNEQETKQEQKETCVQKSKQALKTYFIRDTKIKTGLNIAAKAVGIAVILKLGKLLSRTPRKDLYNSTNRINHTVFFGIFPAILALRELTNY